MSNISIYPVGFACGVKVTGIDLSKPLSEEAVKTIHNAWLDHLLLVFPGQTLDPAKLVEFSRHLGV